MSRLRVGSLSQMIELALIPECSQLTHIYESFYFFFFIDVHLVIPQMFISVNGEPRVLSLHCVGLSSVCIKRHDDVLHTDRMLEDV